MYINNDTNFRFGVDIDNDLHRLMKNGSTEILYTKRSSCTQYCWWFMAVISREGVQSNSSLWKVQRYIFFITRQESSQVQVQLKLISKYKCVFTCLHYWHTVPFFMCIITVVWHQHFCCSCIIRYSDVMLNLTNVFNLP